MQHPHCIVVEFFLPSKKPLNSGPSHQHAVAKAVTLPCWWQICEDLQCTCSFSYWNRFLYPPWFSLSEFGWFDCHMACQFSVMLRSPEKCLAHLWLALLVFFFVLDNFYLIQRMNIYGFFFVCLFWECICFLMILVHCCFLHFPSPSLYLCLIFSFRFFFQPSSFFPFTVQWLSGGSHNLINLCVFVFCLLPIFI